MEKESTYLIGDLYKLQETKIEEAKMFLGISDVKPLVTEGVILKEIVNYTTQDGHNTILYHCLYPNHSGCLLGLLIPNTKFSEFFKKQV